MLGPDSHTDREIVLVGELDERCADNVVLIQNSFDESATLGCLASERFHVDAMPDMPDEVYGPGAERISGVGFLYSDLQGIANGFVVGRIG